ncbi:MAG TPA: TAXI family TRAP transporter solute-binding subunit [Vicinamibacterales bacterium]|nr:TAXI family TRAP transporter solute-binding subunit [Vicinamibacterales bacterium]
MTLRTCDPLSTLPAASLWSRWKLLLVSCLLFAAACQGGWCGVGTGRVQYLSIATGNTGGVYYPYGGGLAKVITDHVPGVQATAEATAASVDNLKLLRDGRADIAFTTADTLAQAVNGEGAFAGNVVPARTLAVLYTNLVHLVTLEGTGVRSIGSLRGRTISTGAAGSGTEITALRILRVVNVDPDRDLVRQALGVSESAGALKDGKIDAFFWMGGVPTPALQDLSHTPGVRMHLVSTGTVMTMLQNRYGPTLYFREDVPAGVYGNPAPVSMTAMANVLVVSRDMPDDLAYSITRAVFEHLDELHAVHPEARKLTVKSAAQPSPAAFHPGAARYYRERGVLAQ